LPPITFTENYDVVVVGAGHAGCEAAMAAARMGLKTALYTLNVDLIAQMSCNPAVGGIAKGHLVREVDALGGIMGEVTDAVGIQFRLLNTSRGPAVWSPRAQCDKQQYRLKMREVLESEPNLHIKQAEVADLVVEEVSSFEFQVSSKTDVILSEATEGSGVEEPALSLPKGPLSPTMFWVVIEARSFAAPGDQPEGPPLASTADWQPATAHCSSPSAARSTYPCERPANPTATPLRRVSRHETS
jgi:hypothetical protein